MRRMVQNLGLRFKLRMTMYIVFANILWLLFAVELILIVGLSDDPTSLRMDPVFFQAFADVVILGLPIVALFVLGAVANGQMATDIESLIAARMLCRQHTNSSMKKTSGGSATTSNPSDEGGTRKVPQNWTDNEAPSFTSSKNGVVNRAFITKLFGNLEEGEQTNPSLPKNNIYI